MLTEKQIQALKNGAYGVTRDGRKVKYIGETSSSHYLWIAYYKDNKVGDVLLTRFDKYFDNDIEHRLDIIGLWEDYKEPFNLERALAGEPIFNNNFGSGKAYLNRSSFDDETFIVEYENEVGLYGTSQLNIDFKMWKEPEPFNPNVNLPKPIREFGDLEEVWFVDIYDVKYRPQTSIKARGWDKYQCEALKNNCYYATKEDCQAVCDWLMSR